jgi:exodeoxyribonuclease VIII
MDAYHGCKAAIGRSALKVLHKHTPGELKHYLEHGIEPTKAMDFGSAVGLLVCEPHRFAGEVVLQPAFAGERAPDVFRGAGAKERIQQWKDANAGKLWLSEDEWQTAHDIAAAVKASPAAHRVIGSPKLLTEQSFFWRDQQTGLMCKARPDWYRPDAAMTADFKVTSGDLDDHDLGTYVASYYAHFQGAMCAAALTSLGLPFKAHALIVARRKAPVRVRVIVMRLEEPEQVPSWLEVGEAIFRTTLTEYAACVRQGRFPHYGETGTTLKVPAYVAQELTSLTERLDKAASALEAEESAA